jgi:hypothetical protein
MFAYRVNKGDWKGNPSWPPSVAADAPNNSTLNATVYVSWNGATEVASWAIVSISLILQILYSVLYKMLTPIVCFE